MGFQLEDDWTITSDEFLTGLGSAFSMENCFRPIVSDVGISRSSTGIGDFLGVIALEYEGLDDPVIIGVGKTKFYLGVWRGTKRQAFYSPSLAKQLNLIVNEKSGDFLTKPVISRLSGAHFFLNTKSSCHDPSAKINLPMNSQSQSKDRNRHPNR